MGPPVGKYQEWHERRIAKTKEYIATGKPIPEKAIREEFLLLSLICKAGYVQDKPNLRMIKPNV